MVYFKCSFSYSLWVIYQALPLRPGKYLNHYVKLCRLTDNYNKSTRPLSHSLGPTITRPVASFLYSAQLCYNYINHNCASPGFQLYWCFCIIISSKIPQELHTHWLSEPDQLHSSFIFQCYPRPVGAANSPAAFSSDADLAFFKAFSSHFCVSFVTDTQLWDKKHVGKSKITNTKINTQK